MAKRKPRRPSAEDMRRLAERYGRYAANNRRPDKRAYWQRRADTAAREADRLEKSQ